MIQAKIINLAIGMPKENQWDNSVGYSAIDKSNVQTFQIKKSGIIGNDVANKEFHGGNDRVICLYPFEHYEKWEKEFQTKLPIPAFGENITALGMREEDICIGDIFQIGDAVVQVTQGRIPCDTISKFNRIQQLLNSVYSTCLTGYFFRVLQEGTVTKDSEIKQLEKHPKGITILSANRTLFHEQKNKHAVKNLLEIEELAEVWRRKLIKFL